MALSNERAGEIIAEAAHKQRTCAESTVARHYPKPFTDVPSVNAGLAAARNAAMLVRAGFPPNVIIVGEAFAAQEAGYDAAEWLRGWRIGITERVN